CRSTRWSTRSSSPPRARRPNAPAVVNIFQENHVMGETGGRVPLAEAKRVVLAKINELRGEAVDLLAQMIRIPSPNPPGNEKAIANFNADYMRKQGLSVTQIEPFESRISNVGRLVGRKNGKKTLLFNSHLDTVALGNPAEWEHPMLGGEIHDDM